MSGRIWNLGLGVTFAAAGTVALVWWIPADSESGILVQDRYSVEIGDAMAPTMAALGILVLSLALIVQSWFAKDDEADASERSIGLSRENLSGLGAIVAIVVLALALMFWLGPLTVAALGALGMDLPAYRMLADTVPYKYIGFAGGGLVLVFALIAWIEGRASLRAAAIAAVMVVALIAIYDIPFDSLLLPPNGSQ